MEKVTLLKLLSEIVNIQESLDASEYYEYELRSLQQKIDGSVNVKFPVGTTVYAIDFNTDECILFEGEILASNMVKWRFSNGNTFSEFIDEDCAAKMRATAEDAIADGITHQHHKQDTQSIMEYLVSVKRRLETQKHGIESDLEHTIAAIKKLESYLPSV